MAINYMEFSRTDSAIENFIIKTENMPVEKLLGIPKDEVFLGTVFDRYAKGKVHSLT